MKPIRGSLCLLAGLIVAGIAAADSVPVPQPIVVEVGPAGSGGVVALTLNAPDLSGATLNVQTLVNAGDSSATVAAKIVASVGASGGTVWTAQASYSGIPGSVTFAYNPGTGFRSVTSITNLRNTACATMSVQTQGPGDISLVFNAGSSGGNQSSLTFQVSGASMPYTVRLFGQSASAIVAGIESYLSSAGISYSGSGSNRIDIFPSSSASSVSLVTNDPGLQGQVTLSEIWLLPAGRGGTDK